MKQAKVLVIDDNTAVLSTLRIVLKSCFSTVVAVADPKLIPALISQGDVDAVLLDMNFGSDRLVDLIMNNRIRPAVNQIESHPFFQQEEAREICREYGVQMEAWAPFAEGRQGIFKNEILTKIGEKYSQAGRAQSQAHEEIGQCERSMAELEHRLPEEKFMEQELAERFKGPLASNED